MSLESKKTKSLIDDIKYSELYVTETKNNQIYSVKNMLDAMHCILDQNTDVTLLERNELITSINIAIHRLNNLTNQLILVLEEILHESKSDSFTEELLENLIKLVEDINDGDKLVERFERLRAITNKKHNDSINIRKEEVFKEVYDVGFEEGFRAAREMYSQSNRIDINDDLLD